MYLKDRESGNLVEVLDVHELVDPCRDSLRGRFHAGEEVQDPSDFDKQRLSFPSGRRAAAVLDRSELPTRRLSEGISIFRTGSSGLRGRAARSLQR